MIIESNEDRDRALYKILINEGVSQEDVVNMIATTKRDSLDQLLATFMADSDSRARDVEIITPDQMVDGVVDFNALKIQAASNRSQKESDAEHAHWERVRDQLVAVMEASGESSYGLISATLNALLTVLDADDIDMDKAKKSIENFLFLTINLHARRAE